MLSVCLSILPINISTTEPICMKFDMYIMTSDPVSTALHKSLTSAREFFCIPLSLLCNRQVKISLLLLGNRSLKRFRGNEYIRDDRRIIGYSSFYTVRVIPRKAGD